MRSFCSAYELAQVLDSFNADLLLGSYVGGNDRLASVRFHNQLVSPDVADLIALFFLNEAVPASALDDLFSPAAQRDLQPFLCRSGALVSLRRYRLTSQRGCYFLCHAKEENGFAYHGTDSLALGRITQRCSGRVLDICTGVGIQGILLARDGAAVECLDINSECEELFWFNAAMNGVSDRVSFDRVPWRGVGASPPGSPGRAEPLLVR